MVGRKLSAPLWALDAGGALELLGKATGCACDCQEVVGGERLTAGSGVDSGRLHDSGGLS